MRMRRVQLSSNIFMGVLFTTLVCLALAPEPIKTDAAWSASHKTAVLQTVKSWVVDPTDVPRIGKTTSGVHTIAYSVIGKYKSFDVRYSTNAQMTNSTTIRHNITAPMTWGGTSVEVPALRANTQYYIQIKAVGNAFDVWSQVFAVKSPA